MNSVRRGLAVMSSGALVVGAGAAVGVMAADMSGQWSDQAALKAAADRVVEDPGNDDPIRRAVIVTRIKERHVTPKPVVVHRKVYVRAPSGQGVTRAKAAPQRQAVRSAPKPRPSRRVVAPAPAAPKAPASAPKATSKTS
jgi:hypothetical protein